MKTCIFKRIFTVALLMLVSVNFYAFEPVVRLTGTKKLIFKLDNNYETVLLKIVNVKGETFFSEIIEKSESSLIKSLDLSNLPDGSYVFEFESNLKIAKFSFDLGKGIPSSIALQKDEAYKPVAFTRESKLIVSKYNPEKSPMTITIFDRENNIVYEETLNGDAKLGKIFDFSKVRGDYTIAMNCNERTYSQNISFRK